MTTPNGQSKLDIIRKLLAKAERAGTPEEAEAFDAKAQELMLRYHIDSAVLSQKAGHSTTDRVTRKTFEVRFYPRQKVSLLTGIANAFGCEAIYYGGHGARGALTVELFGWESDIAMVEVLFASLSMQADSQAEVQWTTAWRTGKDRDMYGRRIHGKSFKTSFLAGFADTVGSRLADQRSSAVDEAEDTNPGTSLVLVDRKKAVSREFHGAYPRTRTSSSTLTSSLGFHSGRAAGERADLGGSGSRLGARGRTALGR